MIGLTISFSFIIGLHRAIGNERILTLLAQGEKLRLQTRPLDAGARFFRTIVNGCEVLAIAGQ